MTFHPANRVLPGLRASCAHQKDCAPDAIQAKELSCSARAPGLPYSSDSLLPGYMTWVQVIQLHVCNIETVTAPTAQLPAGDEPSYRKLLA